jgi:hypothetical protein
LLIEFVGKVDEGRSGNLLFVVFQPVVKEFVIEVEEEVVGD